MNGLRIGVRTRLLLAAVGAVALSKLPAVEGAPKTGGVVVVAGTVLGVEDSGDALVPIAIRADCCLSLIFDIAAASRSCFSHLEYDFVFCNLGLSVAGEAGA